eukprot:9903701-Ditylum_brightwellii.AAC.1
MPNLSSKSPGQSDPSPAAPSAASLPTHTKSDGPVNIKIQKLYPDARVPLKATKGAAGYDLSAIDDVEIKPGSRALVYLGLAFQIPHEIYGRISPRS